VVVAVESADVEPYREHGALAGTHYQRVLEVAAAEAGGGAQRAPAQRVTDFLAERVSRSLPACSYRPGITSAALHELLPSDLVQRLQTGIARFGRTLRGYVTEEAVVVAVESRTSSPIRIPRDPQSLQHPEVAGLYPCGEGAGYAGGIMSAAIDGMRVADACAGVLR
jgi:uncharacterized FAD-dependent dehydrogenase